MSIFRVSLSLKVDTLVIQWDQFSLIYAFPLLKLLPHLLFRIEGHSGDSCCTWHLDLIRLLVDFPWDLQDYLDHLSQRPVYHPASWSTAWLLKPRYWGIGTFLFQFFLHYWKLGNLFFIMSTIKLGGHISPGERYGFSTPGSTPWDKSCHFPSWVWIALSTISGQILV